MPWIRYLGRVLENGCEPRLDSDISGYIGRVLLMVQKPGVHQLRLVVYPIIYRVLYIPGGAGFQPSTVGSHDLFQQNAEPHIQAARQVRTKSHQIPEVFNVGIKRIQQKKNMCQGLNSHYFHIIGDGHQPTSRGLYTHYKDSY